MADYYVREEDGLSKFVLEDGSGDLILEDGVLPNTVLAPFIASVTQLYAPVIQGSVVEFFSTGTVAIPPGVTSIYVKAWGGGGAGRGHPIGGAGGAGGGGGAFAAAQVAVTPGNSYTVTVGLGGPGYAFDGGDSSVIGDSGSSVVAKGGLTPTSGSSTGGSGGQASASTGTTKHSGGKGGDIVGGAVGAGGGGGAGDGADGGNGTQTTGIGPSPGGAGGSVGGGAGGDGVNSTTGTGGSPYGGGGSGRPAIGPSVQTAADGHVTVYFNYLHAPAIPSVTTLYTPSLQGSVYTSDTSGTWVCPAGVTSVFVQAWGGGGSGSGQVFFQAGDGGGGGAYSAGQIAVTPGNTYTFTVGAGGVAPGGGTGTNGGDTTFTGDAGAQIIAKGGTGGQGNNGAAGGVGGQASASTGTYKYSGGTGGVQGNFGGAGASGGGAGGSGNPGSNGVGGFGPNAGGAGGVAGGGAGGTSGTGTGGGQTNGVVPGGGGVASAEAGGPGATSGAGGRVVINVQFLHAPFINSVTQLYAANLNLTAGFITSKTVLYPPFSIFSNLHGTSGPGNGGEVFLLQLAPNGTSVVATLSAAYSSGTLHLTGDSGLPATGAFCLLIDSEVMLVSKAGTGLYTVLMRGISNTSATSHSNGVSATWGDSYDQAIVAGGGIAHNFTANIASSGSYTYPGWLIAFDATQAYLSGSRYPMHVTQVLGVFVAGAGNTGVNRCDAAQPNAVSSIVGISDDCGASLSNPSRISTDIAAGDVALVRFTNPEASILTLGPRAVSLQSWFGLKRVDHLDADVTFTDPTGYVVDTNPGTGRFSADANQQFFNPSQIGLNPDTGLPSDRAVAYTTTTLLGLQRYFTYGSPHYSEKGWPIACMSVRNDFRRVPHWRSWDWHNFNYVYTGFGTDCVYAQLVVNQNGALPGLSTIVNLPGPQDISGTEAMWDDGSYYFGISFYVAIFAGPYLVQGPSIGGSIPGGPVIVPFVDFAPSGSPSSVTVSFPSTPPVEGGSGGDIPPPPPPPPPGGGPRFRAQLV